MRFTGFHICLFLGLVLFSHCNAPFTSQPFSHYINVGDLERVQMNNIFGRFTLNPRQLDTFKTEISNAFTTEKPIGNELGTVNIIMTFKGGRTFVLTSSAESDHFEVISEIATLNTSEIRDRKWLYFDTNGLNFSNFKP